MTGCPRSSATIVPDTERPVKCSTTLLLDDTPARTTLLLNDNPAQRHSQAGCMSLGPNLYWDYGSSHRLTRPNQRQARGAPCCGENSAYTGWRPGWAACWAASRRPSPRRPSQSIWARTAARSCYRASGFLHGFSGDGQLPPDGMVVPLKVRLHRTRPGTTWSQAERMKKLGIQQQIVVSDGWGYGREHPGDDGQWAKWEDFVTHMVQEAQRRGLKLAVGHLERARPPLLLAALARAVQRDLAAGVTLKIRQADPGAVIVGPSWSNVHPGQPRFTAFIRFCNGRQVAARLRLLALPPRRGQGGRRVPQAAGGRGDSREGPDGQRVLPGRRAIRRAKRRG